MIFNIDKTVEIHAELEEGCRHTIRVLRGSDWLDMVEWLGLVRYRNVKAACEFLIRNSNAASILTNCGVTVSRGGL